VGGKRAGDVQGTELSRALSALRKAAGLNQIEVAARAGMSQAELSRTENARSIPDPDTTLPRLLCTLGAEADESARIVDMARAARRGVTPARSILERGTAHFQSRIRDIEDQAELVRGFHPTTILGVLQTQAFAESVFRGYVSEEEAAKSVAERIARHRAMLDGSERRWVLIQTEGALTWNLAGAEAMAEQLDHIAHVSRVSDNVRIGIIPAYAPVDVQPLHGFHVYDFADRRYRRDPLMTQVGTHSGTALLGERDSAEYLARFERLEQLAVFDDEARATLARVAERYRSL
jgi:transcriptional regulator with XRE-family HTH domain